VKLRNLFGMVIAAIILVIPAAAAAKPTITKLAVPPPDLYNIEQLWQVTLNNPDRDSYQVWLEGTITETRKGQVFWAKTKELKLPPGTMVIRYADIQRIGIERQTHAPGYELFAAKTGGLPEGNYTFTVKLMPDHAEKSVGFAVEPRTWPRPITPREGDTVKVRYPLFSWTPPSPMPKGPVTYELRICEVLPGQTKEEAAAANVPWFEQKNIRATSLTYPTSGRALPDSGYFCWQVAAKLPGGARAASAVSGFQFAPGDVGEWWQCNKNKSHFWKLPPGGGPLLCPVKGCRGTGERFTPPTLVNLYWNGDSLVMRIHVKQEVTVTSVRVVVSWVLKDGRQAADAFVTKQFDPPGEYKLCDTLALQWAWPADFAPTGSIKPPDKDKLNLDRTKVKVIVNGQTIADKRRPDAGPPE